LIFMEKHQKRGVFGLGLANASFFIKNNFFSDEKLLLENKNGN
jgi:hypothetical protein